MSLLPFFRLVLHLGEMSIQIVEAALPPLAERLDPVGDVLHGARREPARASLRIASALDQPGLLQNLEVLRDGRLTELERPHQLRDRRLARGETLEDRAPCRIAQRVEGVVQTIRIGWFYCHTAIYPYGNIYVKPTGA